MAGKSLPPGFRFHPTDVELVLYYLKRKVMGKKQYEAIEEVNIYKFSPWDLPDKSCLKSKDLEWFFFCPREKKYASGVRVKRATENGYWKTTGKDRTIRCNDRTVGAVKTLVFHLGHAPQGQRTDWVIHEYRILDDELAAAGLQDAYVLCKVFKKNGPGPKNGAQYGAPFNEADWADDDCDDAEKHAISLAPDGPSPLTLMQSEHESFPFQGGLFALGVTSLLPLPEDPSPSAVGAASELVVDEIDNDIVRLRALFTDEDTLPSNGNGIAQDDLSGKRHNYSLPSDGNEIYSGLRDLDGWGQMHEGILDFSDLQNDEYFLSDMLPQDNSAYIELDDILPPLDCSDGITRADQLSHEIPGIPSTGNIQQHYSGGDDCLDVLPMVDHWMDQVPNASYDLDFAFGQPDGYPANDMERGSQKLDCYSRLMESNPARFPRAAEHLPLSCSNSGGSSMHIKAEVTHGAGECTNEALLGMMEGSGSCWCYLPSWAVSPILQLLVVNSLLYLVEFGFDLISFDCCLIETVSLSQRGHYSCHHNKDLSTTVSLTAICACLVTVS